MIRLIIIRHGRTAWNAGDGHGKRFRGIIDLPLADEGIAQAEATAQTLAGVPVDAVYTSPLQRAVRTSQIIAAPHGLPVRVLPGLGSMDYGDWAGHFDSDVARQWPEAFSRWQRDPFSVRIPGGESLADLSARAVAAVQKALAEHTQAATIVLVSHQAVTRTLICSLVGLPNTAYWRIRQDLCNLNRFDYDPVSGRIGVAGLNDTCHLEMPVPGASGLRLILVRHGQTAWNAGAGEERFRGRIDLPLDETGRSQARAVAIRLKNEPVSALYASPLLRTQQTLGPLADKLGLIPQPHDGLLDIDYGRFQGLTHSDAANLFPEQARLWWTSPGRVRFPGGEALDDVRSRLAAFFDELASRHPGQTVVLAGHQIVNKVAACSLFGLDLDQIWRIQQNTGSINIFRESDGTWHILSLNDCCHLASLL